MCDVRKYSDMFKDMKTLQPEDTLQLIMETNKKMSCTILAVLYVVLSYASPFIMLELAEIKGEEIYCCYC